jgi:peptide chain release factor 3
MAVEHERGISVSSAAMSFEHDGLALSLLDTPRHQDFSPMGFQRAHLPHPDRDRQRGDGAGRRRHGAKRGIEEQTRKLFEMGRLRDVPIITLSPSSTASPRVLALPAYREGRLVPVRPRFNIYGSLCR